MAVWKWFQTEAKSPELMDLYSMLKVMWQQERQTSTSERLAAYSDPFNLENDPEFRKYLRELDEGFSKGAK
jgi:hypothetical protein